MTHRMFIEMPQAIDTHKVGQDGVGLRRFAWLLLFLFANFLSACGGGGGGAPAAPAPTTSSLTSSTPTSGGSATLAWDPVLAGGVNGYRVYYGTAPGTYEQLPGQGIDVGISNKYTVTGLGSGTIYYFAVTAYDSAGESSYSNEASKQMP